ncbi:site-specific integrase [Shewanella sp. SG41-4]|uniref:site-specific integrase n=1 Tax=Shewanella sp. SG41-4 TaxID=2760976 RepID=UPI0016045702|nr:site-specific integrase [Shewanella sp. SG41-4]MBB1439852.1 site-specific integrase [Shewanella sp. SG41-4]
MAYVRYTNKVSFASVGFKNKKGFPVIFTSSKFIHRLSLQYFLSIRQNLSINTIATYASHLCDFLSQLETDNEGLLETDQIQWDEIDDAWFEGYSNELIRRYCSEADNSTNYVSQVLRTVIAYLLWCENQGFARNLIGTTDVSSIRVKKNESGKEASHPLVTRLSRQKSPKRSAPKERWIEVVKESTTLVSKQVRYRYELMIDWCVASGLRAHEVCALTTHQLPLRKTAVNAHINEENVFINLSVTKGSKSALLPISPLLVIRTWDFIEHERVKTLKPFLEIARKSRINFVEPKEIFLSSTTGRAINPRTFSNQVRSAWLSAVNSNQLTEDESVWVHGLRHRYTTNKRKALKNDELTKHLTRHKSIDSLDVYSFEYLNGEEK